MSSPEPAPSSTQVGNISVFFATPEAAMDQPACPQLHPPPAAANDDFLLVPVPLQRLRTSAAPPSRVPLGAWLSLAFWAIGTAVLLILGLAYRLTA